MFRSIFWILLSFVFLVCSILLVRSDGWLDWDMQRYVVEVSIARSGDTMFSLAHNLLKTWLHCAALAAGSLTGQYDVMIAARLLTILFSSLAAISISVSVWMLTRNFTACFLGGALWLIAPGSLTLMRSWEDNAWVAAFNAALTAGAIMASGHAAGLDSRRNQVMGAALYGLFLAIGLNIHQQLVPLFFAFPLIFLVAWPGLDRRSILCVATMVGSYWLFAVVQNRWALGDWGWKYVWVRLVRQEYVGFFPSLWFFTSGQSVEVWLGRILLGLRRTLVDGSLTFGVLTLGSMLIGGTFMILEAKQRGPVFCQRRPRLIALLFGLVLLHVPHSLLYEPENPERWDSMLPALCVLSAFSAHYIWIRCCPKLNCRSWIIMKWIAAGALAFYIAADLVRNMVNSFEMEAKFRTSPIVRQIHQIEKELSLYSPFSDEDTLILDDALADGDLQVRLSMLTRNLLICTVNNRLQVKYNNSNLVGRPCPLTDAGLLGAISGRVFCTPIAGEWMENHHMYSSGRVTLVGTEGGE